MQEFKVDFLTENCEKIFRQRKHVILGISPFTSKYNENYIRRLVQWADRNFEDFSILLAGEESKNLLECLGYSSTKANRKVRKEINRQIRFCEDELIKCNRQVTNRIYRFSDFRKNKFYVNTYKHVKKVFETDNNFKNSCMKMSLQALKTKKESSKNNSEITDEILEYAAQYVLAELPFFLNASPILDRQETLLAYHTEWELGLQIVNSNFNLKMEDNQGYIILTEKGDNYATSV